MAANFKLWRPRRRPISLVVKAEALGRNSSTAPNPSSAAVAQLSSRLSQKTNGPPFTSATRDIVTLGIIIG
jgi:hypothetical protein